MTRPLADAMLMPIDRSQALSLLAGAPGVSAELAGMASRLSRFFAIRAPDAPGLALFGGVIALSGADAEAMGAPTISVTGNGVDAARALASCLGEAADLLSQFERPGDLAARGSASALSDGWIAQLLATARTPVGWVAGHDGHDAPVLVPADLVLRRSPAGRALTPAGALSSGCAAGPNPDTAFARAVFELVERDAAALWWLGGRQPGALAEPRDALDLIGRLRGGATERTTRLLDITTDLGIPAVAACSLWPDGHGLACGVASRGTLGEAARAAILEMAQMELSAPIARAKAAEQGDAALSESDRRHIARADANVSEWAILQPAEEPARKLMPPVEDPAARLSSLGIGLARVDLTRPDVGVPVVRALAPALQPFADSVVTPRLAAQLRRADAAPAPSGLWPF